MLGLAHADAERLGFVRAGNDAAVIVRQHHDRFCAAIDRVRRSQLGYEASRWYFRAAEAFRARFGGQIVPPLTKLRLPARSGAE